MRRIVKSFWVWIGLLLVVAGCALGLAAAGERTLPLEIEIMLAAQEPGRATLDTAAWAVSRAGDGLPALLLASAVAAALFVFRGRTDLALFVLTATALRALGPPLKWLFASPRPPGDVITIFEHAHGFGYPSGHAFGAALVYGAMAVALPAVVPSSLMGGALRLAAIAMAVLIALSRVRLGVHWPSDIVGGLLFGFGLVCLLQTAMAVCGVSLRR